MVDRPATQRGPRLKAILLGLIAVAVFSISTLVTLYTDLLWFREVGFSQVFWKILSTKALLAALFGGVFLVFLLVNLLVVVRVMPVYLADENDILQRYRTTLMPYFRKIALGVSLFLALLFAVGITPQWERILLFTNSVQFGSADPVFDRDIGFFVFRLPMYQLAYGWLFSSLVIITMLVAGAHYLTGGIRPQAAMERVTPQVKAHLSVLIGLIALLRAWGYRLDQFELLHSTRGDVTGASFTDINAELPALKLLVIISIIGALLFLVNIRFKGWALPLAGVGLWLLTSVLAAGAFPLIVQRFRVDPAPIEKERPFIDANIKATRAAYGLDEVKVSEFPAKAEVSQEVVEANRKTIDNIRLFDPAILQKAYRQLEEFHTYYEFKDVDVDRYLVNGEPRQVMLSVRELELEKIQSPSWALNHVFYTHGYGAVVSPTNESTKEGRPKFLTQGIPPQSAAPELQIKQAGVYFGEGNYDYSLVKTKQRELDYDEKEGESHYTRYTGKGGVPVEGALRRAAMAWRFRNINLLISGLIQPDTKILYRRHIRDRLTQAAPFLSFDGDPYPVIADGRIVWMADGYTTTNLYPYSERLNFGDLANTQAGAGAATGQHNYIRNSVKATVDAYDGSVKFYVWDEKDPILKVWRKAFPTLFVDGEKMPKSLQAHVRYPEDMFRIQARLYTTYHVTNPVDFFARKNRWVIPRDPSREQGTQTQTTPVAGQQSDASEVRPYYVLMRLPGAESENYFLILPMNPNGKPNMVSYLAANSDPENYGQINDFRFPRTKTVFGIGQIHSRINANPQFSRERTLLGRAGSELEFGNLLVIPIGESILYVQPLFLQSEVNAIPELKFVVLATGDQIVLGTTLEEAVRLLTEGQGAVPGPQPGPGEDEPATPGEDQPAPSDDEPRSNVELTAAARDHLRRANEALRAGDFATFGRELQAATDALDAAAGGAATPTPSPSP